MASRIATAFALASMLSVQVLSPALADNQMNYKLFPADQAASLPKNGGKLGLNVGRAQQITSGGMTFDLLRVNQVDPGSAGAKAGFKQGDQIIAVDGQVFPSVAAFAGYVGSKPPAGDISVDYMPAKGGPQDAQRVNVTLGGARATVASPEPTAPPAKTGMSMGEKIAIGVGAAALFGCYKMGCFSRKSRTGVAPQTPAVQQ